MIFTSQCRSRSNGKNPVHGEVYYAFSDKSQCRSRSNGKNLQRERPKVFQVFIRLNAALAATEKTYICKCRKTQKIIVSMPLSQQRKKPARLSINYKKIAIFPFSDIPHTQSVRLFP